MMTPLDAIMFEIRVNNLSDDVHEFLKWIPEDGSEPDDSYGGYTYQAWCVTTKSTEGEPAEEEVAEENHEEEEVEEEILYKNRKRGKKFNKSVWVRKERKKSLHSLVDWKDGIDWWQSVDDGGRKIGEKGAKLYTRKGRVAREKFTGEPFDPWYDEDYIDDVEYETDLDIPVGTGYWTDEELSEAINNYKDPFYDPYDCDDYDDELEEVLVDDEDFCLDVDGGNFYTRETALQKHCEELEEEVKKLHDFLNEYNLNTLFSQWEKNNNR